MLPSVDIYILFYEPVDVVHALHRATAPVCCFSFKSNKSWLHGWFLSLAEGLTLLQCLTSYTGSCPALIVLGSSFTSHV